MEEPYMYSFSTGDNDEMVVKILPVNRTQS